LLSIRQLAVSESFDDASGLRPNPIKDLKVNMPEERIIENPSDLFACTASQFRPGNCRELLTALIENNSMGWIWRGQADVAWDLAPSLARVVNNAKSNAFFNTRDNELETIRYFSAHARQTLARPPEDDDLLGWLFIMQHYGAPTRLLDWSRSPLVALFFALADESVADKDAALWFLSERQMRAKYWERPASAQLAYLRTAPHLEEIVFNGNWYEQQNGLYHLVSSEGYKCPLPVYPKEQDARMIAQRAAFTCHGYLGSERFDISSIEQDWSSLPELLMGLNGEFLPGGKAKNEDRQWAPSPPGGLIRKIVIPRAFREQLLGQLLAMHISYDTLFPGIEGLGKNARLRLMTGNRWTYPVQVLTAQTLPYIEDPGAPESDAVF
jgi:FRG domain